MQFLWENFHLTLSFGFQTKEINQIVTMNLALHGFLLQGKLLDPLITFKFIPHKTRVKVNEQPYNFTTRLRVWFVSRRKDTVRPNSVTHRRIRMQATFFPVILPAGCIKFALQR